VTHSSTRTLTAIFAVMLLVSGVALAVSRCVSTRARAPVERVEIDTPQTHWAREGFVEMVPPVRLPSSTRDADDVAVWLKIPDGGVIETRWSDAREGWVLAFPPGTVADRVEQRGSGDRRAVVDVRGTRIGEGGEEWMHTLRRAEAGPDASLFGYEWPRSNPDAHAVATEKLLAELAHRPPGNTMSEAARTRMLDSVRTKNQCVTCHVYERPDNRFEGEHGLVNRGTDASGFFTPQTVLLEVVPLEPYGGWDRNLDDPAVAIECPDGAATQRSKSKDKRKRARVVCRNAAVPRGRLDVSALPRERLDRLCRARRYLFDHLDARGREVYASALDACGN
jgi:hypothetical protein